METFADYLNSLPTIAEFRKDVRLAQHPNGPCIVVGVYLIATPGAYRARVRESLRAEFDEFMAKHTTEGASK